ncbi:MAG: hypothetical protein K9J06_10135 [Flavobacteriales bacterium]|nr:hypothetical protein [Flavobacteriales bacterium]
MSNKQKEDRGEDRPGSKGQPENGQKRVTDPNNPTAQAGKKPAADTNKKSTFGKR